MAWANPTTGVSYRRGSLPRDLEGKRRRGQDAIRRRGEGPSRSARKAPRLVQRGRKCGVVRDSVAVALLEIPPGRRGDRQCAVRRTVEESRVTVPAGLRHACIAEVGADRRIPSCFQACRVLIVAARDIQTERLLGIRDAGVGGAAVGTAEVGIVGRSKARISLLDTCSLGRGISACILVAGLVCGLATVPAVAPSCTTGLGARLSQRRAGRPHHRGEREYSGFHR
jgi:hypothetical protein